MMTLFEAKCNRPIFSPMFGPTHGPIDTTIGNVVSGLPSPIIERICCYRGEVGRNCTGWGVGYCAAIELITGA